MVAYTPSAHLTASVLVAYPAVVHGQISGEGPPLHHRIVGLSGPISAVDGFQPTGNVVTRHISKAKMFRLGVALGESGIAMPVLGGQLHPRTCDAFVGQSAP